MRYDNYPQLYQICAAQILDIPVCSCILFEDSSPGLEATCHVGINCIAVINTNPPEALPPADIVVDALDHLSIQ